MNESQQLEYTLKEEGIETQNRPRNGQCRTNRPKSTESTAGGKHRRLFVATLICHRGSEPSFGRCKLNDDYNSCFLLPSLNILGCTNLLLRLYYFWYIYCTTFGTATWHGNIQWVVSNVFGRNFPQIGCDNLGHLRLLLPPRKTEPLGSMLIIGN